MDRASDSGSEGWGFESLPVCHNKRGALCAPRLLWHKKRKGLEISVARRRGRLARRYNERRNYTFLPMAETKRVRVRTTPRVICRHERRQIDRRCCSSFSGANPLCWALHRFFHATHRIRRWAWRCRLIRENSSLPCLFPEEMPLLRPAAHESVKAVPETDSFAQLLPVNLLSH